MRAAEAADKAMAEVLVELETDEIKTKQSKAEKTKGKVAKNGKKCKYTFRTCDGALNEEEVTSRAIDEPGSHVDRR